MTLERFFLVASLAVGIAQVADAVALKRAGGTVSRGSILIYFAIFEYAWAVFCIYLLLSVLETNPPRLLAALFIFYIPVVFAVAFLAQARLSVSESAVRIPMASVYFGGVFGIAYFVAAAVALAAA